MTGAGNRRRTFHSVSGGDASWQARSTSAEPSVVLGAAWIVRAFQVFALSVGVLAACFGAAEVFETGGASWPLDAAGVAPLAIGFVNAHGTATHSNDATESRSILQSLGPAAARIPVCASKSYFGHTLGASGALESVATLLSLEAGMLPPNLNLERPDPECGIHLVGEKGLAINAELAMKTSFGFGGGNGVLIFRRSVNGAGA